MVAVKISSLSLKFNGDIIIHLDLDIFSFVLLGA